jgi:uncharacterized damage-inducible protein DinB
MPASNPFEILLDHDRWATGQIIRACMALTDEQFKRPFEMGPGSLHNTTRHIVGATQGWGDLLAGREPRPRLEQVGDRTAAELLVLWDEVAGDFARSARGHPLDEQVSRDRGGKMYTFTRGGVITHVATHGMHHRAQCLNMLRQVGVDPLPPSSVLQWMLMVDHNDAS